MAKDKDFSLEQATLRAYERQVEAHRDAMNWRNNRIKLLHPLLLRMQNRNNPSPFSSVDEIWGLLGDIKSQELLNYSLPDNEALNEANYLWDSPKFSTRKEKIIKNLETHVEKLSTMNRESSQQIIEKQQQYQALKQSLQEKRQTKPRAHPTGAFSRMTAHLPWFRKE